MSLPQAHFSVSTLKTLVLCCLWSNHFCYPYLYSTCAQFRVHFDFSLGTALFWFLLHLMVYHRAKKRQDVNLMDFFKGIVFITLSFWHFYGSGITGPSASLQPLLEEFYHMNNLCHVHLHAKHSLALETLCCCSKHFSIYRKIWLFESYKKY